MQEGVEECDCLDEECLAAMQASAWAASRQTARVGRCSGAVPTDLTEVFVQMDRYRMTAPGIESLILRPGSSPRADRRGETPRSCPPWQGRRKLRRPLHAILALSIRPRSFIHNDYVHADFLHLLVDGDSSEVRRRNLSSEVRSSSGAASG